MSNLTVVATYTGGSGVPAVGLALADISLFLTRVHSTTGVDDVVWDGTQNPTLEVDNVGQYVRILVGADLDTYTYHLAAQYTGATVLDSDWSIGAVGKTSVLSSGSVEWAYIVKTPGGIPIPGCSVWVTTDIAGTNVIWIGTTDALGATRDVFNNQPMLDAGTYYFWRSASGYSFSNPDTEAVA